jgi:RNA polymerase sigma-70 factor, ECF subfamily
MPLWTFQVRIAQVDFGSLLLQYQNRVYQQAYRMLGTRQEAEEATQDIFLKIHGGLSEFRGESKLSSWVYRITANVCISRLRKKQLNTIEFEEIHEGGSPTYTLAGEDNPETRMRAKEMGDIVREELRTLPPQWAQAISLHYFGGESYEEIATILEIPRATVATYISRGKQQLAKQICTRTGKEGVSYS